jgi:hypothetical protein
MIASRHLRAYDFYADPDAMGSAPVGIGKAISTNYVRSLETSGLEMLAVSLSHVDPDLPSRRLRRQATGCERPFMPAD